MEGASGFLVEEEEENQARVAVLLLPVLQRWNRKRKGEAGSQGPAGSPGLHMEGVLGAPGASDQEAGWGPAQELWRMIRSPQLLKEQAKKYFVKKKRELEFKSTIHRVQCAFHHVFISL